MAENNTNNNTTTNNNTDDNTDSITGYCVKCKQKRVMKDPKEVIMKGKGNVQRRALTGTCPECETKMFRILGKKK